MFNRFKVILLFLLILEGCSNKNIYTFNKTVDKFNPLPYQTFKVSYYNNSDLSKVIVKKLTEKLKNIPLKASKIKYADYVVFFMYKKMYLSYPTLDVWIYQTPSNMIFSDKDLVYKSKVLAGSKDMYLGLALSLKIITYDLLNKSYKTGITKIYLNKNDLQKYIKNHKKEIDNTKKLESYKTLSSPPNYHLFAKKQDYNW